MAILSRPQCLFSVVVLALVIWERGKLGAECPEQPKLQNFTGETRVVCPCFVPGEEAGVVVGAPAEDYPIEILRIGIAWGSVAGGNLPSLEGAIHVFSK